MTTPTFAELGVPAPLVAVLAKDGKTESFPIQADTLPDTLGGRDVLGRGKTGSGKTIAFAIPMAARLGTALAGGSRRAGHPLGLVLAPTRELATQIDQTLAPLAAAYGLKTTTIFGGVNQTRQVTALRAGVDIVVACPGRLEDLMKQGHVSLDAVEITVLDEADHMADLGFLPVVTRLLQATPADGQRMLFSATLDNGVDKLVKRFLHNEVLHSVDEANSPVAAMTHHVFEVDSTAGKDALIRMLASGLGRRILFTRTKHQAKKLAKKLNESGIPASELHGNLSQNQRDRNLGEFHEGTTRVMVATDVAARGVHVDDVELVVHVDPPLEHKAYLHRSGRTARAGSAGDVVTICLPEQRRDLSAVLRAADIKVAFQPVTAQSAPVVELVGPVAPLVAYVPQAAQQNGASQGGRSQGANAQRKRAARSGAGAGAPQGGQRRERSGRPAAAASGESRQQPARTGSQQRRGQSAPRTASASAQGGSTRGGSTTTYSTSTGGASHGTSPQTSGTSRGRGPRRASSY